MKIEKYLLANISFNEKLRNMNGFQPKMLICSLLRVPPSLYGKDIAIKPTNTIKPIMATGPPAELPDPEPWKTSSGAFPVWVAVLSVVGVSTAPV